MSWIQRRRSEEYYKKSKLEGYRSRAVYKLKQINRKFSLIHDGMNVLDLGASPGSWSQYVSSKNVTGKNVALDVVPFQGMEGVYFIKADINDENVVERIMKVCPDKYDLVLSDLLMHTSGDRYRDQANSFFIAKRVLEICNQVLKPRGNALVKTLQGDLTEETKKEFRKIFRRVFVTKPPASLPRSPEIYILGVGFSGHKQPR